MHCRVAKLGNASNIEYQYSAIFKLWYLITVTVGVMGWSYN